MSNTFCILPWIHAHFYTNGDYRLCCMSGKKELVDEGGRQLSLRTHTLREIWNSPALREVRRKMLAGEQVAACATCDHEEREGEASHRTWAGEEWLVNDPEAETYIQRVERAMQCEHGVDQLPVYYDIRPGNQCNLACRMCNASLSSKIAADPVHSAWRPGDVNGPTLESDQTPWYRDESVLVDQLLENVDQTRKFYFAGGEPLINPIIPKVIDILIERGAAKHIKLQFSTNATFYDESFYAKLAHFRQATLFLSLDGIESDYEYLRYPGKWAPVLENLQRLTRFKGLICVATPTVQNYNVLALPRLLELVESLGFDHNLNFLYDPAYLSLKVLPEAARREARERLASYAERSTALPHLPAAQERVKNLFRELDQPLPEADYRAAMQQFIRFTNELDASRGQSLRGAFPELHQFILEDGFDWDTSAQPAVPASSGPQPAARAASAASSASIASPGTGLEK